MTFQLDFLPIRTGIHPFVFFELAIEVSKAVEPTLVCDLSNGPVGFGHDDAGLTNPDGIDIFHEGHTESLFKKVAQ